MERTSAAASAVVYGDEDNSLSIDEALAILVEPNTGKISHHAIKSPQPGNIFLFNKEQVLLYKDGLKWIHCGRHSIPKQKPVCQKTYYKQQSKLSSLHKEVYTALGIGNQFILVHYINKKCRSHVPGNRNEVSSILRDESSDGKTDDIDFYVRKFNSQPAGTRLCGFYAFAAAVSCCLRKDPTGCVYDAQQLVTSFNTFMSSEEEVREPLPSVYTDEDIETVLHVRRSKLYCICQQPDDGDRMIQCTFCSTWFHKECVTVSRSPLDDPKKPWKGPCCTTPADVEDDPVRNVEDYIRSTADCLTRKSQSGVEGTPGVSEAGSGPQVAEQPMEIDDVVVIEEKSTPLDGVAKRNVMEENLTTFILNSSIIKEHVRCVVLNKDTSEETYL